MRVHQALVAPLALASAVAVAAPINGGFEVPAVPGQFLTINPGSEPSGFGWRVMAGTVDAVVQGFFGAAAFEGTQWLDLDGASAGTIIQSFETIAGTQYIANFAYANNPYASGGATVPARATFRVFDDATSSDLLAPLQLLHGSSTPADLQWTTTGDLTFTATGAFTTFSFQSNNPTSSFGGLFLDGVVVTALPGSPGPGGSVPEPSTALLALLGLVPLLRRTTGSAHRTRSEA